MFYLNNLLKSYVEKDQFVYFRKINNLDQLDPNLKSAIFTQIFILTRFPSQAVMELAKLSRLLGLTIKYKQAMS